MARMTRVLYKLSKIDEMQGTYFARFFLTHFGKLWFQIVIKRVIKSFASINHFCLFINPIKKRNLITIYLNARLSFGKVGFNTFFCTIGILQTLIVIFFENF